MSELKQVLASVKDGTLSVEDALLKIKTQPFEDIGFAKVDLHRKFRQGAAEVIYGAGKTPAQMLGILRTMQAHGQKTVLITRLREEAAEEIGREIPLQYDKTAGVGIVGTLPQPDGIGRIAVVTGGTSDIPVAEEAALTAQALGNEVLRLYDVGVAGLHRLLSNLDEIMSASVVIAIAGMEGALASVVGGLVDCPVIDNGFGAGFLASRINHMEAKR